jgi:ubiquinone/menaquinone biosynthesis C-methylase UbiE
MGGDDVPSFVVVATLLALAGVRDGDRVLDAGCGAGALTFPAAAAAGPKGRVFGVDDDAAALVSARERRPSRVGWVRADSARLPFADGTLDKVLSARDGERAPFAEYARVLKPGGRLALVVRDIPPADELGRAGLRLLPEAPGTDHLRYVSAVRT